jgi:hypothetical protein
MGFTHIFAKKDLKRLSADRYAPDSKLDHRSLFSSEGVKRQKISGESLRSSENNTTLPPGITSVSSDGDSAFTVSMDDSATTSSSGSPSETEQSPKRPSIVEYCKSLFRRHDSQQAQPDSTPLDPFEQAYMGQLATVDVNQLLKDPDGPSDYWRKSPLFKSINEEQERRESSWSTESAWILNQPATSPFPPLPSPEPQPPRDRIRWTPISWLPSKLRPRRLSAKSRGKRPQSQRPASPSTNRGWKPISPPPPPRPSTTRRNTGGLKITFDSHAASLPIAIRSDASALACAHIASATQEPNNDSPSSLHLGPTTRNTSMPMSILSDSPLSADSSGVSSEMMFRMSPDDTEAQSDTDASVDVSMNSDQALIDLEVEGWPELRRFGGM